MSIVLEDRIPMLDLKLESGGHRGKDDGFCVMEMASYLRGEPWGTQPQCVSPVLSRFLVSYNDALDDEGRQKLKRWIDPRTDGPVIYQTAGDGFDELRGWLIADWAIRVQLPTWLELAGITDSAEALRSLPPIRSREDRDNARTITGPVYDKCYEIRKKRREEIKKAVQAELKKRGLPAVAVADAVADAAAAAVADAVADAAADAVAVAVADAAAVAVADAAAAAVADAVADAAAAARYSPKWYEWRDRFYREFKEKLTPIYEEKLGPTRDSLQASAHELLDTLCDAEKLKELAA